MIRNHSRRLDRLNAGVAAVLSNMRKGAALYFEYSAGRPQWRLSNGLDVRDEIARLVIASRQVVGVGDALFADATSQTFRYAGLGCD